jgi:hypothetical protein
VASCGKRVRSATFRRYFGALVQLADRVWMRLTIGPGHFVYGHKKPEFAAVNYCDANGGARYAVVC